MYSFLRFILITGIAMFIAMPGYAEAPVYDADSLPQQFENTDPAAPQQRQEQENGSNDELPSAPGQEAEVQKQMPASQPRMQSMSLEQRMSRLEQQLSNLQNNDYTARINSLQGEVQALRSQIDQQTHEIQQLQNSQRSMYSDLDKRLAEQNAKTNVTSVAVKTNVDKDTSDSSSKEETISTTTATVEKGAAVKPVKTSTRSPAAKTEPQPNVAEEQEIYQTAYNYIKAKKYNEAVNALQKMLQNYPSGQFAANAHYWLGELYGLMGKNDLALKEFTIVVTQYNDNPRVSDAQLKLGLIYAAQFKWADAKAAFKKVINRYPGTASARLAADQIKQIKQAGH